MAQKIDLNSYISREIRCSCGRTHYSGVKHIDIGFGAATRLPALVKEYGYKKTYLIADRNTWPAAGERVAKELDSAGIPHEEVILDYEEAVPDETVIGEIIAAAPMDCDLVIGVGAGVINDLGKFVSHRLGKDYFVYASAPSMDGFVSIGSALMLKHVKTTLDAHGPVAVIGDLDVLKDAPMNLIAAGLGDTLGKYTCLLDWKLSRIINDEYYCEEVVKMVEQALATVNDNSAKVKERDPEAIRALMEALVLTGLAMSFVGNSRPASGCEHHLSHYWEMKSLMKGELPPHHGTQVGVAMIIALRLYHDLAKEQPDFDALRERAYAHEAWKAQMRAHYDAAAEGIIALEEKAGKNNVEERNRRLDVMKAHWAEMQELITSYLPATEDVIRLFRSLEAPVNMKDMGLPDAWAKEGVEIAKEVRERYTLLQLLWDLGLSKSYAEKTEAFLKNN